MNDSGKEGNAVITNLKIPDNAYGIWKCPALQSTSILYKSPVNATPQNQKVVDREDCALWWPYGKGHAIIDHVESRAGDGIWDVSQIHIDDMARLIVGGKETMYVCVGTALCKIRKYDYAFKGKAYAPLAKGDIVCLSCSIQNGWVYAAYFEPMK